MQKAHKITICQKAKESAKHDGAEDRFVEIEEIYGKADTEETYGKVCRGR
jgi:hypothetical protein